MLAEALKTRMCTDTTARLGLSYYRRSIMPRMHSSILTKYKRTKKKYRMKDDIILFEVQRARVFVFTCNSQNDHKQVTLMVIVETRSKVTRKNERVMNRPNESYKT